MVSAVGAYIVQVIGGRSLGAEGYAPVSVIWTMLFIGFTVFMVPIEQMVIRRTTLTGGRLTSESLRAIGAVVVVATVVSGTTAVLLRPSLLDGDWGYVAVAVVMFPLYAIHVVGRGVMAGHGRFASYGIVVGLDAVAKVAGTVAVVGLGMGGVALCWVLALASLVVFIVRPWQTRPGETVSLSDAGSDRRFLGGYLVATGASQVILASGPLALGALGASAASVSVFFITTTLFRGPLSASYNLLARLLPSVTRRAAGDGDAVLSGFVRRVAIGGVALAAVAGAGAAVIGPWVVETLYGSEFRPSSTLAGLAAAAVLIGLAALLITQVLVGRGHTGRLAVAWLIALGAYAGAVGFLTVEPTVRVATALLIGEVVALAALVFASLARSTEATPASGRV